MLMLMGCVAAQGQALRNLNGNGTNTTLVGGTRIGTGNIQTNVVFVGATIGDGAGLTNLVMGATNSAAISAATNLFILGTRYTNSNRRAFVSQCFTLNGAAAGTASVTLSVEQGNGITNVAQISAGPLASLTEVKQLSMMVGPTARYTFTDASSGSGATVSAVTNTATLIGL